MKHGQFKLGSYTFGTDYPVYPASVKRGQTEWRTHDVENPVADRLFFGTDYRSAKPWEFEFTITGDTPAEATDNMLDLIKAWDYMPTERKAGTEQILQLNRHGNEYVMYGRARDLDIDDNDAWVLETIKGTGTFQPSEPVLYEAGMKSVSLTITPADAGGLIFPAVFPWGTYGGTTRAGIIEAGGGRIPTHNVTITIHGPIANPVVKGPGWTLRFDYIVPYDRSIVVDARQRTAKVNGASIAGKLTRSSRLSDITIPTGRSEIAFEGTDRTGTSQLTVAWRPVA